MAGTMSGGITMQGLGSGTDFSAMIEKLKTYESIPKARMEIWRSEWSLRVNAFQSIMDTMSEVKTALASFDSMDKVLARTVSSSNESAVTATADSSIPEGVYSIEVKDLARAAIFSSKTGYDAKTAKINSTGAEQTFSYTYKGSTRTIKVANNSTIEDLVNKINNDAQNPGVQASLIKSGTGYVFQIQGKETGAANSLSVESTLSSFDSTPLFSGYDSIVNNTGAAGTYTYFYKGNSKTVSVDDGMTMGQMVERINNDNTLGVTAYLEMQGSDSVLRFKDSRTGMSVAMASSSNLEALGGQAVQANPNDPINSTGSDQTFSYTYLGSSYNVTVTPGMTQDQLRQAIQNQADARQDGMQVNIVGGKLEFSAKDKLLTSNDGQPMTFKFTDLLGKEQTISVKDGATMREFAQQFNATYQSRGMKALVVDDGSGNYEFQIGKLSDGTILTPACIVSSNIDGISSSFSGEIPRTVGISTTLEGMGNIPMVSGKNLSVNSSATAQNYSFTLAGAPHSISVPPGTTLTDFETLFNNYAAANNLDIRAQIRGAGSGYELAWTLADGVTASDPPDNIAIPNEMRRLRGAADNYYRNQATDARFTLNGWGQEYTSASNRLTEVIEGLDITLKDIGKANLGVVNDKEKVTENIYEIVDLINEFKTKIKELTKYDPDKDVKKPEVDDSTGLLKMASQFTWQKGSVLTGNYGVQLLNGRTSNLVSSRGKGFVPKEDVNDYLNDMFSSLAQVGITTNSNESDSDFGLLTIDEAKLSEALDKDFYNVCELFGANKAPDTDSSEFSVASVAPGTKAGVYDVSYEVDANNRPYNVTINGVAASASGDGRFTVGDYNNAAAGLSIQFTEADLDPSGSPYSNTVRIKDGKVQELITQLQAEMEPVVEGNVATAGAIPGLISNYKGIIKNIDKKIERETVRLAQWEKRMKAKYSRLDTMLSEMYSQMEKNQAALAQAGGSSGSGS